MYAITVLWFSVVLFWPRSSNNNRDQEEGSQNLAQEDLYRANLTQANFGLLGVRFYESVEGQPRWKIESQFAELHRKENYAFLKGVTAIFFSEATQNKILTKSDYGRSWSEKNYVELDGNVSIESGQGYLFWMNHLNYDGKKHEFSSNDTVQMKGPNINRPIMFLKGTGLNAQINKEHFILNQNVSSQKKLENGQWLKIFAKAGEFFTNESRAVFIGGVKSMMPDIKITSDIFELSSEEGQENVQAFGNVILKNKDRIGYAQKAYLEIGGSEIILEGKARIEADGNVIEGKRIKLYSDDDKIEVEEAEGRTANETSR
jgi:LPS export ABC transporter protein LptC/lipopolysaccharide transport protein LptA